MVVSATLDEGGSQSGIIEERTATMDEPEGAEAAIGIEDIAIGLTREVLVVAVIPVRSDGAVVVLLVFVGDLELVWELSREAHQGIVVGELPSGELYRVTEIG